MVPRRGSAGSSGPYPFVGISLVILVLHAVLVATLPPNPYRSAVTIAALFATGYCALALIVGRTFRLSSAEILAYTVGLAILITSLSAIAVSIIGIPITDFAITVIGLPIALAAWFLRGPHAGSWASVARGLRHVFDFSEYSGIEKVLAGGLLAAIVATLVAFLLLSTVLYPDRLSPGLAIVGPDGTPGSLPSSFGHAVPQSLSVSALGGSVGGTYEIRIRLIPGNATGNESFHAVPPGLPLQFDAFAEWATNITLVAGGTRTLPLSLTVDAPGSFDLRFDLIDSASAVVASSRLPIVVS